MRISNPSRDEVDRLSGFIASLIVHPEHRVASYIGRSASEISAFLTEELEFIPVEAGFVVARDDDRIVGVLGISALAQSERAYLLGPFVDHADWEALANQLWADLRRRVPDGIRLLTVACDERNLRCKRFLVAHDFERYNTEATLELSRASRAEGSAYVAPAEIQIEAYTERYLDQFRRLHPGSVYYTAEEVLARLNPERALLLALRERELIGYAYLEAKPAFGTGEVCFIRVAEPDQRKGIGTALLARSVDWLFGFGSVDTLRLFVRTTNHASLALVTKLRFETVHTIEAYRRNWDVTREVRQADL